MPPFVLLLLFFLTLVLLLACSQEEHVATPLRGRKKDPRMVCVWAGGVSVGV